MTASEVEKTSPSSTTEPRAWLLERWKTMQRIRSAEEAIARMVDSGEAGCPCHLYIGQEAIAAGVCSALGLEDTIWGGHRSHGHYLAKGGSLEAMFAEILGKETGCSRGRGGSMHLMAPRQGIPGTVPIVAATVPLAVGAAMAYKMRHEPHVAVAFFGDGTLEEGHVHESLNLAALYRLPVLFVCENNLYASHMHWSERRVADNLHQAGLFHSVPGERLDGNDVTQVGEAARRAITRARQGDGPTFLECRTFRWRGHVGSSFDLDVGVERRGELSSWLLQDPIARAEEELGDAWEMSALKGAIEGEVEEALHAARRAPAPSPSRVLEHVFAKENGCGH
jgi:acetoin:2,6-dichlorophenolindophenol oxidoreductase subunit alpha